MLQKIISLIVVISLMVFVGWMFGYDFDHRNIHTGIFTVFSIAISAVIFMLIDAYNDIYK